MRHHHRPARVLVLILLGATSLAVLTPRREAGASPRSLPNVGHRMTGLTADFPKLDLRPECPMPVHRGVGEATVTLPTTPNRTSAERAATIILGRKNAACRNPLDQ